MRLYVSIGVASALVALIVWSGSTEARSSSRQEWQAYKQTYGKVYESPEEDARRFARFLLSKAVISSGVQISSRAYELALNHLSDWTQDELEQLHGRNVSNETTLTRDNTPVCDPILWAYSDESTPVPDNIDWRRVPNRVNPVVLDQGRCNVGWAIAAAGVLDGQQVIRLNSSSLVPLSAQDIIDCTPRHDCYTGWPEDALEAAAEAGGVMSAKSYPFIGAKGKCKFIKEKAVFAPKGSCIMTGQNENNMKKVVAKYGPISVKIDSACLTHYKSGIFDESGCYLFSGSTLLLVGYGTDPKDGDYWIAKNSWGAQWGEQGYVRLRRGKNIIGIAKRPALATF